jgi:RNA-binding protein 5/10
MAYNRDWDKGKDYWGDQGSWGTGDSRENARAREDDYYGDGKRRKYNNGVRVCITMSDFTCSFTLQGYDNQPYDDAGYDAGYGPHNQGRHTDYTPDHSNDDRPGKGFQSKKRLVPSEASSHVIFLGLDPDFSEADVCRYTLHVFQYETKIHLRTSAAGIPLQQRVQHRDRHHHKR